MELSPSHRIRPQRPPARVRNVPLMPTMRLQNLWTMTRRPGIPRKRRKRTKVRIGRRTKPLRWKPRTTEHMQTTQRLNLRLWLKSPVSAASGSLAERTKVPKKKKKKSAELERFQLEQREAKAKEMAWAKHQRLQRDQDFKALRNYRKTLPADLLDTINGADHSAFLLGRLQKEGNYMNKKSGRKRNLMLVKCLLSWIAKYANEPQKRLKEAHQMTKATFPMVQGMPSGDKCTPALVVRVLTDCKGNIIACDHPEYGKEQNIRLHDVVSLPAMARVTATETYMVDGVPTTIKADYAYCPFCSYACSNHQAINNHMRMHFRAILMCGLPGCYFVHMQSKKMIEHSPEVHNMAQDQPSQEKGGD